MPDITVDYPDDGIARITLNRPEKLNAFSYSMYGEFLSALDTIRYDPMVRVVILTGAGKAFCAGHDVTGTGGQPDWVSENLGTPERQRAIMAVIGRLPVALRSLPQPVIGAINGAAAGIGFALALSSDLCVTTTAAKFAPSFHNTGTGSELGASWLLPRLVGLQHAMDILLTGRTLLGDEAARIGLAVAALADNDALTERAMSIASQIRGNVPRAVNLVKQSVWAGLSIGSFEAALELEQRAIAIAGGSDDAREIRAARAEKRPPVFRNQ